MGERLFNNTLTLRDAYKVYKENYSESRITYPVYAKIIKRFNQAVMDKVLYESFEFALPYNLGNIRIRKAKTYFKPEKMKVNWVETKKIGKRVFHMNEHTNYFNYRFYWQKYYANFTNKHLYSFTPTRANKRALAAILKDPNRTIDYYE